MSPELNWDIIYILLAIFVWAAASGFQWFQLLRRHELGNKDNKCFHISLLTVDCPGLVFVCNYFIDRNRRFIISLRTVVGSGTWKWGPNKQKESSRLGLPKWNLYIDMATIQWQHFPVCSAGRWSHKMLCKKTILWFLHSPKLYRRCIRNIRIWKALRNPEVKTPLIKSPFCNFLGR